MQSDVSNAGKQLALAHLETDLYPASATELTKSDGTNFSYTINSEGFELTGFSDKPGTKSHCITHLSTSPSEGPYPTHDTTAESCFTSSSGGTITAYSSDVDCPRRVVIPREVNGTEVKAIGSRAFQKQQLTGVTIPNSVAVIGNNAFYINQLTSIKMPSSVKRINSGVFWGNQLTTVSIPASVSYIGTFAFHSNKLTNLSIPDSVTTIDRNAFSYNRLTAISIPDSVVSIGQDAFSQNPQLANVTIPGSVTTVGTGAFSSRVGTTCRLHNSSSLTSIPSCKALERY